MKRKNLFLFMIITLLVLSLTACNSGKTVKTKQEVKQMAEAFYEDLLKADNYKMSTYSGGELVSAFTKDQDKMHVETFDPEYGYDYYLFIKDGTKYIITDDGTLMEDESMYSFSIDTLSIALQMGVLGYFDVEDDTMSYTAVQKDDNNLNVIITGKDEGNDYTITNTGKKEDNKVTYIMNEIKYGEETIATEYQFSYDEHIELPEYTVPKTYNNLPHVDSPYKTFGEIINKLSPDETLFYSVINDTLIVIDEYNNRHYQFSSKVSQEFINEYGNLDFMADDYEQQAYKLLYDLPIEDCIDFTDELISQDELNNYVGKTIGDLITDKFEINGYVFSEDTSIVYALKDMMTYKIEVEPSDGFDFDGEHEYYDFYDFVIKSMIFEMPEYAILPMS